MDLDEYGLVRVKCSALGLGLSVYAFPSSLLFLLFLSPSKLFTLNGIACAQMVKMFHSKSTFSAREKS